MEFIENLRLINPALGDWAQAELDKGESLDHLKHRIRRAITLSQIHRHEKANNG